MASPRSAQATCVCVHVSDFKNRNMFIFQFNSMSSKREYEFLCMSYRLLLRASGKHVEKIHMKFRMEVVSDFSRNALMSAWNYFYIFRFPLKFSLILFCRDFSFKAFHLFYCKFLCFWGPFENKVLKC